MTPHPIGDLIEKAVAGKPYTVEQICGHGRYWYLVLIRLAIIKVATEMGFGPTRIAHDMNRQPDAIHKALKKIEHKGLMDDTYFRSIYRKLKLP